jgi:enamine deaminase RidA (YjgF/YER057c/UK114 family)
MSSNTTRQNISSGGAYEAVFGYSRAVRIGAHIHVSGTCAPVGYEKSDVYTQTHAALAIIGKALAEGKGGWADVIRTVVYVKDMNEAENVARAHVEIFGAIRPASTLVQVDGFMRPWQKVEIEAYAILGAVPASA